MVDPARYWWGSGISRGTRYYYSRTCVVQEYGVAFIYNLSLKYVSDQSSSSDASSSSSSSCANGSCELPQLKTVATEQLLEQLRCALVDMRKAKEGADDKVEALRSRAIANLTF